MSFLDRDPEMQALLGGGGTLHSATEPVRRGINVLPARTGRDFAIAGGAHEGASRTSRELASWAPPIRSVNQDVLDDKDTVDGRSRDVMRNDAFVASGANLRKDGIVGDLFMLNAKPAFRTLGLDEKWAEEFQDEVEEKFTLLAESPNCWLDASRINTLTDTVRLAVGVHLMGGEVVASAEWMREGGRPCRTAVQMIDADRLSNPPYEMPSKYLQGGVHRDRYGAPQGYWFRKAHPGDIYSPEDVFQWQYVSARTRWGRQKIIHIFEQFRPDQVRGISEMASMLKELRTTRRFREIVLQNAVVNATYAASIESELPTEAIYQAMGAGDASEEAIATAIQNFAAGYLGSIATYASSAKNLQLDGVKIPHLYPGTKLQMRPAGSGGPLGTEFEQSLLRYVAAGLGVSYEELSRDYSETNYSSGKLASNNTLRTMRGLKRRVADRLATSIYHLSLEEMIAGRQLECMKTRKAPDFWDGLNREAYGGCSWLGASIGQVDELKETQAAVLRMRSGLSTDEIELGRLGHDYRAVYRQRQREKVMREDMGIEPATDDKMMNAASGSPREKSDTGEKEDA